MIKWYSHQRIGRIADDKIEKEFNDLNDSDETKKWIRKAIEELKQNALFE